MVEYIVAIDVTRARFPADSCVVSVQKVVYVYRRPELFSVVNVHHASNRATPLPAFHPTSTFPPPPLAPPCWHSIHSDHSCETDISTVAILAQGTHRVTVGIHLVVSICVFGNRPLF